MCGWATLVHPPIREAPALPQFGGISRNPVMPSLCAYMVLLISGGTWAWHLWTVGEGMLDSLRSCQLPSKTVAPVCLLTTSQQGPGLSTSSPVLIPAYCPMIDVLTGTMSTQCGG